MIPTADRSALDRLYPVAEGQAGHFTAGQAMEAGVSRRLLAYHSADGGALVRVDRGVYRLRNFPPTPREELMAIWLAVGRPVDAVFSHESALELHELSDIIPSAVHMTASRAHRGHRVRRSDVRLHFSKHGVPQSDRTERDGLPVTSVERTLLDMLATTGVTEQSELAVAQALDRGQTSTSRLGERAADGSKANRERLREVLDRLA